MLRDKRGKGEFKLFLGIMVVLVAFIILMTIVSYIAVGEFDPIAMFEGSGETVTYGEQTPTEILKGHFGKGVVVERMMAILGGILSFVIGSIPVVEGSASNLGSLIVVICIWGMMALAFGDIFRNLSFFSDNRIAFSIAILLSIAAANLGIIKGWFVVATSWFAIFGAISVYLGLGASFLAFIVVELGLTTFGPWLMRRKAMQDISKKKIDIEAGGEKLETTIGSFGKVGDALADLGKKRD